MALGAGASLNPTALGRQVQDLESAGVDLVWAGEIYGFDLVSNLPFVAAYTSRMQIMTGIRPIYSRSPALIAQTAMTIDTLSEGRFILGLGAPGHRGMAQVPFTRPLGRTRDVIEICRKVWSGDKVEHDGQAVSLPSINDRHSETTRRRAPADGQHNLRVVGSTRCDGLMNEYRSAP